MVKSLLFGGSLFCLFSGDFESLFGIGSSSNSADSLGSLGVLGSVGSLLGVLFGESGVLLD